MGDAATFSIKGEGDEMQDITWRGFPIHNLTRTLTLDGMYDNDRGSFKDSDGTGGDLRLPYQGWAGTRRLL